MGKCASGGLGVLGVVGFDNPFGQEQHQCTTYPPGSAKALTIS
jgi:hypothetical protein